MRSGCFNSAIVAVGLLVVQPAVAAPAYPLDEYLKFIIFDCTLSGTEEFDVTDARSAGQKKLGFEAVEEKGVSISYRNPDGARLTISMNEKAPSCSIAVPAKVHETRPRENYEFDTLWGTYERLHDGVEVVEGILGGLTYRLKIEWGYRVSANLRLNNEGQLIFSATTLKPE